ncbi:thiamine phosphate synthase [Geosporobacter ferrireducens]|uniref:Thiamine-phosphate synthase n=1 Tax=Geosporobacter ferrireducens TaxID=1424294 RepID=A0A1D8GG50_9FIRM|nr:thiamine phosphate synthase [Geosporobacter ferrireducens]AOT69890.1 thiamine-phosphate diphosphorylase [Geosporobacter ferrireducens]MTI54414.1 thiamine phosphate synthase [Geosporobacter ferrireducens]
MKHNIDYGLYLVTDRDILKGRSFISTLEEAIAGGVTIVQLREKNATSLEFYQTAVQVKALTSKYGIPLMINDRLDIALAVDAEGLHVGQSDLPASVARKILGEGKLLGVSAANIEEALKAQAEGADYIGVGALFPTNTKTDTRLVNLAQLAEIKKAVNIPVVGIGGIQENNVTAVGETGIDGIAVVSAILAAGSVKEAAMRLRKHFM